VGVVADCNSGAMAASLPAERHGRPGSRSRFVLRNPIL
jgi:hypothetical protein